MTPDPLPVLFFEAALADEYLDLIAGRATAVGPDRSELAGADGVIAAGGRWDAATLAGAPRVRVVSRSGVGYDSVDVPSLRAAGIEACYAPDAPTVSTAEHAVALMMAITKDLPAVQARSNAGLGGFAAPRSLELAASTLGLVGFGRIARRVAVAGAALGMRVIAHDPYLAADAAVDGVSLVPLATLLAESDVVSLHAPATEASYHLIGATTLATMKPGAYLVNCARGGLVDQDALLAALDNGHLAGAGLDVTEPEPLPAGHPLLDHPKVIVTPHIASSTRAGRRRLFEHAIDNALAVLDGRPATLIP